MSRFDCICNFKSCFFQGWKYNCITAIFCEKRTVGSEFFPFKSRCQSVLQIRRGKRDNLGLIFLIAL